MIFSYDTLTKAVQKYLQRTDASFMDMMPVFVQLAQQRIVRELKILDTTRIAPVVLNTDSFLIQKPVDWVSTINLTLLRGKVSFSLEIRTFQYIVAFEGMTERPLYYADRDAGTVVVNRCVTQPDDQYTMQYTSYMMPLGPDQQANPVIERLPQLFLYATLLETASFLREDERLQTWAAYYEKMKEAVTSEDIGRIQQARLGIH